MRFVRNTFVGLLAALGLLVVVVTFTPLTSWWGRLLAGRWDDPRGEILIVLGGGIQDDGLLGLDSYWRSVYAVRVYRAGGLKRIILTGGKGVAEEMRSFMVAEGVPDQLVVVEARSGNTRENALFTAPLLTDPGRKVLLTSDFHMFRAHLVFQKVGIQTETYPIPDVRKRSANWRGRWPAFLELVTESCKIAVYFVRGWM